MNEEKICLECRGISKIYPGVRALNNINLAFNGGTIHGLVGRNGAGKSTLVNILYGKDTPTEGKLFLNNNEIKIESPIDGLKKSIALVSQEPSVFDNLTIAENLALPNFANATKANFVNWIKIREDSELILEKFKIKAKPEDLISDLSIGHQQLIIVGKVFYIINANVVLLDEVTSSINLSDKDLLYSIIEEKKMEGKSIVFITHSIKEIYEICDYVTVVENGEIVKTEEINKISSKKLVNLLFGKDFEIKKIETLIEKTKEDNRILSLNKLTRIGEYRDISFDVKKNEIIGLVGLRGAGKTELLKTIAGFSAPYSGNLVFNDVVYKVKNQAYAIKKGIVYLPEDRDEEGLIDVLSVSFNITISTIFNYIGRFLLIKQKSLKIAVNNVIKLFNIKTPSLEQEVKYLSGGNKQKVLIGRYFMNKPLLYLLDEPVRGLDIETKQEVLKIIKNELTLNATTIITSPDLEDLLGVCDRLVVLFEGKVTDILEKPFGTVTEIYQIMHGLRN